MKKCIKCDDTGVIETGNNDLPCDCAIGDTTLFTEAGVTGFVTGKEVRRHFLNNSPEPIETLGKPFFASNLPGRQKAEIDLDELQRETRKLLTLLENRLPGTWNEVKQCLRNIHKLVPLINK